MFERSRKTKIRRIYIDTSKGILVEDGATVFAHYNFKELNDDIEYIEIYNVL